jgi:hypothetical protein
MFLVCKRLIVAKNKKNLRMFKHPLKKSNKKNQRKRIGSDPKSANSELRYSSDLKNINRDAGKNEFSKLTF